MCKNEMPIIIFTAPFIILIFTSMRVSVKDVWKKGFYMLGPACIYSCLLNSKIILMEIIKIVLLWNKEGGAA